MTRNSLWKFLSIAAILALLVVACGDDDDDADPTSTSPSEGGAPTETRETGDGGGEDGGGDAELVAMGEQLYTEQGCMGCHTIDGSALVGPSWQGIYGSEETLDDGSTVTVDDAYLEESIVSPDAKVVEGFSAGTMPPYDSFSDEQISAIIAFIESLSE